MTIKVKHTKNGNVKITMSLEQAKVINWCLTYTATNTDGYLHPTEIEMAKGLLERLNEEKLY